MTEREYDNEATTSAFVALLCAAVVLFVGSSIIIFLRRDNPTIRYRKPGLLFMSSLICMIYLANVAFSYIYIDRTKISCTVFHFMFWMCNALLGASFIVRILVVIYEYNISLERSNMTDLDNEGVLLSQLLEANKYQNLSMDFDALDKGLSGSGSETDVSPDGQDGGRPKIQQLQYGLDDNNPMPSQRRKGTWYIKHRSWFSTQSLFGIAAVIILLTGVIPSIVVYFIETPQERREDLSCNRTVIWNMSFAIQIGIYVMILLYLFRKYCNFVDAFSIRKEIQWTMICVAVGICIFTIWGFFTNPTGFPIGSSISGLTVLGIFACSTVYPIYLSRMYKRDEHNNWYIVASTSSDLSQGDDIELQSNDLSLYNILSVLQCKETREMFKKHLISEFSVENLLFWEVVERFRRDMLQLQERYEDSKGRENRKKRDRILRLMYRKASVVFHSFIAAGSYNQINLPYDEVKNIKQVLESRSNALKSKRSSVSTSATSQRHGRASVSTSANSVHNSMLTSAAASDHIVPVTSPRQNQTEQQEPDNHLSMGHTLFDRAQKNILDLMRRDSFPRFAQSHSFEQVKELLLREQMNPRTSADATFE